MSLLFSRKMVLTTPPFPAWSLLLRGQKITHPALKGLRALLRSQPSAHRVLSTCLAHSQHCPPCLSFMGTHRGDGWTAQWPWHRHPHCIPLLHPLVPKAEDLLKAHRTSKARPKGPSGSTGPHDLVSPSRHLPCSPQPRQAHSQPCSATCPSLACLACHQQQSPSYGVPGSVLHWAWDCLLQEALPDPQDPSHTSSGGTAVLGLLMLMAQQELKNC